MSGRSLAVRFLSVYHPTAYGCVLSVVLVGAVQV